MLLTVRHVILSLFAVNLFFGLFYLFTRTVPIGSDTLMHQFDMNAEANMLAWYGSMLTWSAALLWSRVLLHTRAVKQQVAGGLMAGLLVFLSVDETAQIHEAFANRLLHIWQTPLLRTGPWVIAGIPALAMVWVGWNVWPWRNRASALVFSGLAVLFASATGPELISNFLEAGSFLAHFESFFEETAELTGATMLLLGSYDQYKTQATVVRTDRFEIKLRAPRVAAD